jgi:hypothetical protein
MHRQHAQRARASEQGRAQAGLCALALLDPASAGFAGQLELVRAAAGRWARQPLQFTWVNAPRQVRGPAQWDPCMPCLRAPSCVGACSVHLPCTWNSAVWDSRSSGPAFTSQGQTHLVSTRSGLDLAAVTALTHRPGTGQEAKVILPFL